jgi:hypothetical protein
VRPGESLARDRSRGQVGGSRRGKRPPPGRARAGDRGLVVELAIEPVVENRRAAFRGPAGSHGPVGERSTPDQAGGKTQARPKGGPFRHREGVGEPAAAKSPQQGSKDRGESIGGGQAVERQGGGRRA